MRNRNVINDYLYADGRIEMVESLKVDFIFFVIRHTMSVVKSYIFF